ncbi:MAG: hypothetical protein QOE08_411 [Thermoleophilaceae bacterium]|nr:hypothetical protein [Thermoleophilaceae bacterium]
MGGNRSRRALGALACLLGLLAAMASAANASAPKLRVLTTDQRSLRAGTLDLAVSVDAPARVTLSASSLGRSLATRRTIVFSRAGHREVALKLTAAGRDSAAACGRLRVVANARARSLSARRSGSPAFAGASPSASAARTLKADPRGCYRMGIASRSINPGADGKFAGQPVYLGGYGFGGPPLMSGRAASGLLGNGVSVRAVSISDGKKRLVVADIETQGWFAATKDGPYGLVDIRKEIARRSAGGVTADRVLVQSDHSHSGPDTIGVWGGVPVAYRAYIVKQTVDAALAAMGAERPGTLYYGAKDGRDLLSNQFDYDAVNQVMDSEVRVLQARDPDGRAFATLLNFSAHATVLGGSNTKVSGDWPQTANPALEKRFGGRAITMVGTLGRTQPADRGCADKSLTGDAQNLCSLNEYSSRVVSRTAQAVDVAKPIPGKPSVAATSYLIQDPATSALILGLNYAGDPVGAPINRSTAPPWLLGNVLGTVTATARIGDVLLSSMPGEGYPQIPLKVRSLVPARGYMTAGLSNDQLGYLIAPFESYPEPIRRSFFNQRGDEVSPIDNDNYFFNVSHTMGERVTCSLLRGAGEVSGKGSQYRSAYDRCALFANDEGTPEGQDTK